MDWEKSPRLPSKGDRVLIWNSETKEVDIACFLEDGFEVWCNGARASLFGSDQVFWMPLPKPPQDEDQKTAGKWDQGKPYSF